MKQHHSSSKTAGIDVGKHWLDAAVDGGDTTRVKNDAAGIKALIDWLTGHAVERVGLEAGGGYERQAREVLAAAGFATVLHQPLEVRLFARLTRQRAKNDRLDARLIAAATAALKTVRPAPGQPLAKLAEHLTVYEQVSAKAAELKTFLGTVRQPHLRDQLELQIAQLKALKQTLIRQLVAAIKADAELAARFHLLSSLPGVGPINAASLLLRMPELGRLERGQAASLIGVAPSQLTRRVAAAAAIRVSGPSRWVSRRASVGPVCGSASWAATRSVRAWVRRSSSTPARNSRSTSLSSRCGSPVALARSRAGPSAAASGSGTGLP